MKCGLIGKTLVHSFSSEIHPKLYDCTYENFEISAENLGEFLIKRDFDGINVTIPYKTAVMPFLDFIDEKAKKIGAVNTVVNKNGKLYGYNTDYDGVIYLLQKNNIDLKNKNVLILGSGATSKTVFAVAKSMGADSIIALSRTEKSGFDTYNNISNYYDKTDVIINTTPCGMYPDIHKSAINLSGFLRLEAVLDTVYNPLRTKFICDAKKLGITADGGLGMLVFQALCSAKLISGKDIEIKTAEKILNDIIFEKENIVLIGMPESGKTTIGKMLAEKTGKEFVDTDSEIIKATGKTPKEIIENYGEEKFRDAETEIIKEISKRQSLIIATGGGAVTKETNMDYLKENGRIILLKRDIEKIKPDNSRPLLKNKENIKEIYKNRADLYEKYGEITVNANGSPDETLKEILNKLR